MRTGLILFALGVVSAQRFTTTDGAGETILGQLASDNAGNVWTRVLSTLDGDAIETSWSDSTTSSTASNAPASASTTSSVSPSTLTHTPTSTHTSTSSASSSFSSSSTSSSSTTSSTVTPTLTPQAPSLINKPLKTAVPTGTIRDMESYQASLAALHNPALASTSISLGAIHAEMSGCMRTHRLPVSVLALAAVSSLFAHAL